MSKNDININTSPILSMSINIPISDLISYIRIHGITTDDQEVTNKIADIIGNKSMKDLTEAYQKDGNTFLFTLKYIWSQKDIINFFNNYVNPQTEKVIGLEKTVDNLNIALNQRNESIKTMQESREYYHNLYVETQEKWQEEHTEVYEKNQEIRILQNEIISLKAALYDEHQDKIAV